MTLLSKQEIIDLNIVRRNDLPSLSVTEGFRSSTFDSRVGTIVTKSGVCEKETYTLKPRGIVWLISAERFRMPENVTGITTLRTTWTRQGILTLTVGIVDPCYDGPLTTAVINFGKNDFCIKEGEPFFRTAFFKHEISENEVRSEEEAEYRKSVISDTNHFSDNFLTIDSLAQELVPKMFSLPRWGVKIGLGALILGLLALVLPPAIGINNEIIQKNVKIEALEKRIQVLEGK